MKFFRVSTMLALTLSIASGAMLFSTAQKVQQADSELSRMKSSVAQEAQTIRVLRAEWDYLNRPDRLEALVKNNLELIPATSDSVRNNASELPGVYVPVVPTRKPSMILPAVVTPAVMAKEPEIEQSSSSQALPRPAAPQSPETASDEAPRKDFQKLLNELSPAGGDAR